MLLSGMSEFSMRALRYFFNFVILTSLLITTCSAVSKKRAAQAPLHGAQKTHCLEASKLLKLTNTPPVIVLDAGHGGTDRGAKVFSLIEKKLTLTTTLLAKKALEDLGYKVMLTRNKDIYVPLPQRVAMATKLQAMLFVSIHYNTSKNQNASGVEIFYHESTELWKNKASRRLGNLVLHQILDQTAAVSRGVKKANFFVVRETNMPAILVEAGFMTNLEERHHLMDKHYLEKIALGIAKGIDKYLKS